MLNISNDDYCKYISRKAQVSQNCKIDIPVAIGNFAEVHSNCEVGAFSLINNNSILYSNVKVGRYCSIARFCEIGVAEHPLNYLSTSAFQYSTVLFKHPTNDFVRTIKFQELKSTTIGSDVWIGAKSVVSTGVNIGIGSIIGALSFCNKDIPPYAIAVGSRAKIIKFRFSEKIIQELLDSQWWNLDPCDLREVKFDNVELAIS